MAIKYFWDYWRCSVLHAGCVIYSTCRDEVWLDYGKEKEAMECLTLPRASLVLWLQDQPPALQREKTRKGHDTFVLLLPVSVSLSNVRPGRAACWEPCSGERLKCSILSLFLLFVGSVCSLGLLHLWEKQFYILLGTSWSSSAPACLWKS